MFCIPAVHEFNHGMAHFGGYRPFHVNPQYYSSPYSKTCYHSAPSAIFTSGRSLGNGLYPGGSGMPTVTHPPEMQQFCSPHGTLGRPLYLLQLVMVYQPTPFSITRLVWNAWSVTAWSATAPYISRRSYLSGCGLSTVTHLPGISGRSSSFGTTRPPQYEQQPQSVIPGDPHPSDPTTSSVTHLSVIPPHLLSEGKAPRGRGCSNLISLGWTSAWNAFTKCNSRRSLS